MNEIKFTQIVAGNTTGVNDLFALDTNGQLWFLSDGESWVKIDHPIEELPNPADQSKAHAAFDEREARRKNSDWPRDVK